MLIRKIFLKIKKMIVLNKQPIQTLHGIPRYIEVGTDYTQNFGFQWNKFAKTQIDSQKNPISRIRFFAETEWEKIDLSGKNVLEVGRGASGTAAMTRKV
jgi:hypothetical protein